MKEAAAVIVLNSDGKVLALKRSSKVDSFKGHWNFPAGGVEDGENPIDCAIRECKEEAGIVLEKELVIPAGSFDVNENTSIDRINYFFSRVKLPSVTINFESSSYLWVSSDDIAKMKFVPIPDAIITAIKYF